METVKWECEGEVYEVAKVAFSYPLLEGARLTAMSDGIKRDGLLYPILRAWLPDSDGPTRRPVILDGRNRLRACRMAGVQPRFEDYDGETDDWSLARAVLRANKDRQHVPVSTLVKIGRRIEEQYAPTSERKRGRPRKSATKNEAPGPHFQRAPQSTDVVGAEVGVSGRSVRRAKRVEKDAVPEVREALDAGEVALKTAEQIAALPANVQPRALTEIRSGRRVCDVLADAKGHADDAVHEERAVNAVRRIRDREALDRISAAIAQRYVELDGRNGE